MKRLLHWFFPERFFTDSAYFQLFALGMLYAALLILQLFTYEQFFDITMGYGLPGGRSVATVVAILIPLAGLLALPSLISLRINTLLMKISRISVVVVPALWLVLALWMNLSGQAVMGNTGLFGATITTRVGWWIVLLSALLLWSAILAVRAQPRSER